MQNILDYIEKSLVTFLLDQHQITMDQLHVALNHKKGLPKPIDQILVDLGYISINNLLHHKSLQSKHPYVDLTNSHIPDFSTHFPVDFFHKIHSIPIKLEDRHIHVAMSDPDDIKAIGAIKRLLTATFSHPMQLTTYHGYITQIQAQLHGFKPKESLNTSDASLKILEQILVDAIDKQASDIHFQPEQHHITVRFRMDSLLTHICVIPPSKWPQILNRLKVLAQLDVAESRRPQSGHFLRSIHNHDIDIRVSTHPTLHGENMVLRLLDKAKRVMSLDELGLPDTLAHGLKRLAQAPQGMIIITGPTGAGKTTSLYALLSAMDTETRNIMTLEAPIEAVLPGIRQTEIRENNQLNYSSGIRSLLRQDPDVILIGEIRDEETAKMALRAVLTGHLVLSTMHTQDALGVPSRLIDLGLPPVLLAGALQAVIAQRLVRRVCQHCHAQSCARCTNGYKGRIALVEHMIFDEESDALITKGADRSEFEALRCKRKFPTLWDHGLELVRSKQTTQDELIRVLGTPPKNNHSEYPAT